MTREDVFAYTEGENLEKEVRKALQNACSRYGGTKRAARALGLKQREIQVRMKRAQLSDMPGQHVVSLTIEDLINRTRPQLRRKIRLGRIQTVEHLGSDYTIAKILGERMKEWHVRRAREGEARFAQMGPTDLDAAD